MKKTVFFALAIIILGTLPKGFAQKNKSSDNNWVISGTELTYHVTNVSKEYDFIINNLVIDKDISFSWKMTDPVNYTGTVKMYNDAIDTAIVIVNYFSNNSSLKLINKTTVWVSRKIYKILKGQSSIDIYIDDNKENLSYKRNEKYNFLLNGNPHQEEVILAETTSGYRFWILDNPMNPIILKMELAFTIELKSVETNK